MVCAAQAAGGIIRHALQQLEAMGLVEKNPAAQGGRRITPEGQRQVRCEPLTFSRFEQA